MSWMADNLVRRWIMAEWTFQKLHQIIYILRSAKNFNPKWLKASGRAVGFRVRCHTTADKHGPWPLRYRMAVCTTRPACQQCLSTYEKKKKKTSCHNGRKHKLSRSVPLPHPTPQFCNAQSCTDTHVHSVVQIYRTSKAIAHSLLLLV